MSKKDDFIQTINQGYTSKGESIILGAAMLDGETLPDATVKIPLKTKSPRTDCRRHRNRKTKTIQVLSEQLSSFGIPVLMMDIKGDFSGIAKPGEEKSFITERHAKLNIPYQTASFPVELLSLSQQSGVRLRATVSEFTVLFSRILGLNDVQAGVSVIFKYCDDHKMPLLDLKDIKKIINYITEEGKEEIEAEYGKILLNHWNHPAQNHRT
jgi:hypothetical protein